jgi:hypothetical protein
MPLDAIATIFATIFRAAATPPSSFSFLRVSFSSFFTPPLPPTAGDYADAGFSPPLFSRRFFDNSAATPTRCEETSVIFDIYCCR